MFNITRREFLVAGGKIAALLGLGTSAIPEIVEALEQFASGAAPVVWLQGQSCSGCSVSLLDAEEPGPVQILTQYLSVKFHSTLSTATGDLSMQVMNDAINKGGFVLVVEGSVPEAMPDACVVGHEAFTDQLLRAARKAGSIVAVGACAAYGGLPAAENNPTGSVGVVDYLKRKGISTPVIRLPGCPVHPEWLVGTLVHALKFGIPPLDDQNRPVMFYSRLMHDQCPRFADYEREKFAKTFSEEGCYFKLGCLGPLAHADCNLRLWNGGTNSCIIAGAPCIGCVSENFGAKAAFPFYRK